MEADVESADLSIYKARDATAPDSVISSIASPWGGDGEAHGAPWAFQPRGASYLHEYKNGQCCFSPILASLTLSLSNPPLK